ncbi:MAG: hydrogenase expression/formation protein HypE [Deltaproteobacteria bacterium]|nr:hydrogenase expression/formation protein HypE [Deltaproteobacteria bacterium]
MKKDTILLDHGSGGKMSHLLITDLVLPIFDNPILSPLHDGAVLDIDGKRLAFSTDTFVVDPIFFPGGSIGDLASIASEKAGVKVVTGDTKVVPKGAVDKIFVNTSGIGKIPVGVDISSRNARPGDKIILSGTIGDHGVAVLTQREGMTFDAPVKSDTAPLSRMVERMVSVCSDIHVLRDPTRGGVGTALNEIAGKSGIGIKIYEEKIPLKDAVAGICELLGFDPIYIANEGKLIAFVDPRYAEKVLAAIKEDEFGKDACIIGEVMSDHPGRVIMETRIGGIRIVDMLTGEQLPRIC